MFIILKEVTKVLGVGGEVHYNWEIYPAGSMVLCWVVRPHHRLRSSMYQGSYWIKRLIEVMRRWWFR